MTTYEVLQLVTTDATGLPRMALLGRAEVGLRTPGRVRLLLWRDSTTSANLQIGSGGLLVWVEDEALRSIRFRVEMREDVEVAGSPRLLLDARVHDTKDDTVPYARLVHGLEFELVDAGAVARWDEAAPLLGQED